MLSLPSEINILSKSLRLLLISSANSKQICQQMWYIYDIYFTKILFILLDYPKHDNFDIKWHNPSGQNRQKKEYF